MLKTASSKKVYWGVRSLGLVHAVESILGCDADDWERSEGSRRTNGQLERRRGGDCLRWATVRPGRIAESRIKSVSARYCLAATKGLNSGRLWPVCYGWRCAVCRGRLGQEWRPGKVESGGLHLVSSENTQNMFVPTLCCSDYPCDGDLRQGYALNSKSR